ncbi:MAG: histidine phosphatase family protein [Propionibacteriales bacterium]|nr:histidine phosphatase family protein [Propionibacteriales bacterium]
MGQIVLVRHGQASFGAADYDALSPLGFEQARLLGVALAARNIEATTIVGGRMRRHRETAETCAAAAGWSAGDLVVDAGWDEFDFLAVLAAHPEETAAHVGPEPTKAEFQRWFEAATAGWIAGDDRPYEETFVAFTERVAAALDRTVALAGSGTVAVFTSGGPVAWAVASVLGGAAPRADLWTKLNRMSVNSGLTRLVSGSRGVNLLSYNEQSHLDSVPGTLSYR